MTQTGRRTMRRLRITEWDEVNVAEVKEALRKAQKWKSPGIGKGPNFWLNTFDSIHENMTASRETQQTLNQTHNGLHKELHTYYLNLTKRTSLKTIDHAYQPCIKL